MFLLESSVHRVRVMKGTGGAASRSTVDKHARGFYIIATKNCRLYCCEMSNKIGITCASEWIDSRQHSDGLIREKTQYACRFEGCHS